MIIIILIITLIQSLSIYNLDPQEQTLKKQIQNLLNSHLIEGSKWNMTYHTYRPGLQKYGPYQWLWDSAFHMIAWSRINVTNSILDLRTMLKMQDKSTGKISQMVFWGKEPITDKIINRMTLSSQKCTDTTQMPMLAFSLQRIYQETGDKDILEQFLPRLVEYHQWWKNTRQPQGDGLVVIIHPWESGLDASPMYDQALKVNSSQPTWKQLYPNFFKLLLSYKYIYKWKDHKIIGNHPYATKKKAPFYFVVKEVGVNAIYTAGWKIYQRLAEQMGNPKLAAYCASNYEWFRKGLLSLWDSKASMFKSLYLDKDTYRPTRADTVQTLFPLVLNDLPEQYTKQIIKKLTDDKHYFSEYPIPSVSKSDPTYKPVFDIDLMWRGPSWAAPNYFILYGLRKHNESELYKQIGQRWKATALKIGIWEMWNPQTGQPYGVKGLGMSTSILDIIYRLKQL